jgi:hypothetical protein
MTSRLCRRFAILAILILSLLVVSACDEALDEGCPAITVIHPEADEVGAQCAADEDCQFGMCYKGEMTTGAAGFCSKPCDCGEGSDCADHGFFGESSEAYFLCQRPGAGSPDRVSGLTAFCAPQCFTLADCGEYGAFYTACDLPSSGSIRKFCQVK